MCCVSIGYRDLIMPADKGMKLVELLQHAVECERGYERPEVYTVGEQPHVQLTMIKPRQIRAPEGAVEAGPAPARRISAPRLLKRGAQE